MYPTSTVVNVHEFAHSDSVKRHLPNEYAADLAPAHFRMVLCLQKHSQVAAHHGIVVHDEDAGAPRGLYRALDVTSLMQRGGGSLSGAVSILISHQAITQNLGPMEGR
jgi:hypothetical protein